MKGGDGSVSFQSVHSYVTTLGEPECGLFEGSAPQSQSGQCNSWWTSQPIRDLAPPSTAQVTLAQVSTVGDLYLKHNMRALC